MKSTKPTPSALSALHVVTIAIVVMLAVAPALAADLSTFDGLRSLVPRHAGWTMLAGIGLVAVVIAAFSVRRPRLGKPDADDTPLGRMHDEGQPAPVADATNDAPVDQPATPMVTATAQPQTSKVALRDVPPTPLVSALAPELPPPASSTPSHAPATAPANGSQLFLALQHVDLSIDVLRRHLQREPRPMPAVWLMLLDLCRTHGREQTFQELAVEFHRRFNVCTPAWEGFPPGRDDPGLEAYPRLVKEITLAWGTHECRRLLERLLYDNRGAQRKGFTLNAYNDLIALRRAADAVLDSIEKDASPAAKDSDSAADDAAIATRAVATHASPASPLVSDLESQLESDLRNDVAPQSAIEREHPALAGMLAREWGNAAMSARLCDMLARGGDSTHVLSREASEEFDLLRGLAARLSAANGIALTNSEAD